jgi:hypothetical protein
VIFRLDIIEEAESIVHHIQENLKAAKSRQETYANKRRRPLEYEVGNHVYLRVSPMKGVKRFGVKGKLAPRYIRPFSILEKCGIVAYKLDLPPSLARVHDIFHVSQLKKYLKAPVDIVLPEVTPLEADLSYPEHPIKVLDQKDRVTMRKTITFFNLHASRVERTWRPVGARWRQRTCSCRVCDASVRTPLKRCLRLTSGPDDFLFKMIFKHPHFDIRKDDIPNVQILPNFS